MKDRIPKNRLVIVTSIVWNFRENQSCSPIRYSFQGALVSNDAHQRHKRRWCLPGQTEVRRQSAGRSGLQSVMVNSFDPQLAFFSCHHK